MPRLPSCLALLLLVSGAQAGEPIRRLAIAADVVVLARPLDPVNPTRFRVVEVLRGKEGKAGEVLTPDLAPYAVRTFDPPDTPGGKPRPRPISLARLFLSG